MSNYFQRLLLRSNLQTPAPGGNTRQGVTPAPLPPAQNVAAFAPVMDQHIEVAQPPTVTHDTPTGRQPAAVPDSSASAASVPTSATAAQVSTFRATEHLNREQNPLRRPAPEHIFSASPERSPTASPAHLDDFDHIDPDELPLRSGHELAPEPSNARQEIARQGLPSERIVNNVVQRTFAGKEQLHIHVTDTFTAAFTDKPAPALNASPAALPAVSAPLPARTADSGIHQDRTAQVPLGYEAQARVQDAYLHPASGSHVNIGQINVEILAPPPPSVKAVPAAPATSTRPIRREPARSLNPSRVFLRIF